MADESSIQHKHASTAGAGLGFDDAGQLVPVALPEVYQDEETSEPVQPETNRDGAQAFAKFLARLSEYDPEKRELVLQVIFFKFKFAYAARSIIELAERLCTTRQRMSRIIQTIEEENPGLFPP